MHLIFETRLFHRWRSRAGLTETDLCKAVLEMSQGLVDADLGGGIVKKRIGAAGRGKRGGFRTLAATRQDLRWFFVFGFAKNDRSNITAKELEALQALACDLLSLTPRQVRQAVDDGTLQEIPNDPQDSLSKPTPGRRP